jgi:transcriptional regulator with XRE-family HTH domain
LDEGHQRLADAIRAIAKRKRLVLTHIPDRTGISQAQFWNILAGKHSPTLRVLLLIAEAMEVDISEFFAPDASTRSR